MGGGGACRVVLVGYSKYGGNGMQQDRVRVFNSIITLASTLLCLSDLKPI